MRRILIAVGILSLTLVAFGSAEGAASPKETGDHYSQAQLKQMAREARTPEQYDALASYYNNRQKNFLHQAADEKQEWERRSQYTTSISAKYPRPVDSAHNLYEYYEYKASEAGELSEKYRQLAQPNLAAQSH